jgi:DNA-binding response OmpR family regulator
VLIDQRAVQLKTLARMEVNRYVAVAMSAAATQLEAVRARLAADIALINRDQRAGGPLDMPLTPIIVGELEIDRRTRTVRLGGAEIHTTGKEYQLLCTLAAEPERVFTKEELLRDVWGFRGKATTRTLDSHACRLRAKLGGHPWLNNVWGIGYRLVPAPAALRPA